ncbi:hypothetical protein LTS08_005132 [Lithohypha guttulata]|nr:hypothetical protein LTS08_005132 [Lithohypha guttulata]
MSDFKGIMKGGWHPKGKDGGRESWRGDFKGINQVAGWMGKGKHAELQAANEHVSRPLATLKDPSSFGPPPKNVNYHGGAALPNEITPHREGLGAPLPQDHPSRTQSATAVPTAQEVEQSGRPSPPVLPYRADRTGLRTDNLPPPPVRAGGLRSSQSPAPTIQPRLPPRLPTRQNTRSPPAQEPPPPSYDVVTDQNATSPFINQAAVGRLGKAGVSVPGLGIGNQTETNPWANEGSQSQTSSTNQLSELHSRFAKVKSPSHDTTDIPTAPNAQANPPVETSLPSWQQSQSAFKTAQNMRMNPQSVTLADAQSAAQTASQAQRSASGFKEKHADKIANAQAKAKSWDQRYKVTSKINKFLDDQSDPNPAQQPPQSVPAGQQYQQPIHNPGTYTSHPQLSQNSAVVPQPVQSPPISELSASIARKPPPPPAPRKPANLQAPPPVPTGTKPNFG